MPRWCRVIDEIHEILRRAVIAGWGEVAGDLIAPGAEERMIHDRQKLHMGVSQPFQVVGQLRRQLAIGQRAITLVRPPAARSQRAFRKSPWAYRERCADGAMPSILGRPTDNRDSTRWTPSLAVSH